VVGDPFDLRDGRPPPGTSGGDRMIRSGLPRWIEVPAALAVLAVFSPLMLIVAGLVKLTSRGPALYRQKRVGAGGRPFVMVKFRTMVAGRASGPQVTAGDDARMTAVGRVLRKLKLDELPELWNVVRGDMALVGPRPEVARYIDRSDAVTRAVLRARPGVTDPMTARMRNEEDLLAAVPGDREAFYRARLQPFKMRGSRDYLKSRSWRSDLVVLLRSVLVVLAPKLTPAVSLDEVESASGSAASAGPSAERPRGLRILLRYRRPLAVVLQLVIVTVSHYAALLLRFDGSIPAREFELFYAVAPVVVGLRLLAFLPFRLYEGFWRYVGIIDLRNIAGAVATSSIAAFIAVRLTPAFQGYPRSVFVIDAVLSMMLLGGVRVTSRVLRALVRERAHRGTTRVLIYGAGDAGAMIARELTHSPALGYRPVGFIDDDPAKAGARIYDVQVLGTRADLARIIAEKRPSEVLLAVPRADVATIRRMVQALAPYKVRIATLPSLRELIGGHVGAGQIRSLAIEDLLSRPAVGLDRRPVKRLIEGRRVMVTGAGGSIGSELCRQIASLRPASLVLYERYENSLYQIAKDLDDRGLQAGMRPVLGDITDVGRLDQVMREHRPEIIFHAAAHKHVPLMELNPCEAVKNNVAGTRVLAQAAKQHGVDRFILISSDKAVNPSSVMGATKRVDELMMQLFADRKKTAFITVRFGNVLGSSGSVIPRFLEQIRAGGPVTVTHPDMKRFFMLIPEAVELVLHSAAMGKSGSTYVLEMGEPVAVAELARNVIQLSGFIPEKEIAITYIGLRPGEKLEEELVGPDEEVELSSLPEILQVRSKTRQDPVLLRGEIASLEQLAMDGDRAAVVEQLGRIVPAFRDDAAADRLGVPLIPEAIPAPTARTCCPSCHGAQVRRSRTRSSGERAQKELTGERLFECESCGWRGWMLSGADRDAIAAVTEHTPDRVDLNAVDSVMTGNASFARR
jgi:FlaA1/EpsC-like NDP-sugar epimerase/lipopolysaccharide/colanic/teichoic acid biosynthesis glycosyltransferase